MGPMGSDDCGAVAVRKTREGKKRKKNNKLRMDGWLDRSGEMGDQQSPACERCQVVVPRGCSGVIGLASLFPSHKPRQNNSLPGMRGRKIPCNGREALNS